MAFSSIDMTVVEAIKRRKSCRTYDGNPIEGDKKNRVSDFIAGLDAPPFGSAARFRMKANTS
jgi:hypothetical protein